MEAGCYKAPSVGENQNQSREKEKLEMTRERAILVKDMKLPLWRACTLARRRTTCGGVTTIYWEAHDNMRVVEASATGG